MDREFRTPQDLARTAPDRVEQALAKVLRRGVEGRPFMYRLRFEFQGGRVGPVLFIGNVNRSWNDYITGNARANDMATGVCSTGRGPTGRTEIRLTVTGGRGNRSGYLLDLNRMLRRINAEALFVEPDGEEGEGAAAPAAAGEPVGTSAADSPEAPDLRATARVIRERFEQFKAGPTPAGLEALIALTGEWMSALEDAPDMRDSKEAAYVGKLVDLLAEKGQSYLAKAGTGG